MDISFTPTEEEEVFFEMTGLSACVNIETETVFFDLSYLLKNIPKKFRPQAENIGILLDKYGAYMTIYDFALYCMAHEPLHYLVARLKPRVDYCPLFYLQGVVDNQFLDDIIMEDLGIKLHKR